eukprot:Clim_evm55s144 gene=Clim_evmTU55s144
MLSRFALRNRATINRAVYSARRFYAAEAAESTVPEGKIQLTFASAREGYFEKAIVQQVIVPADEGNMGILAKHVPTLGVMRPGVATVIEDGGQETKFFVSSGTITVNPDSTVQILAEEAVPLDQLDAGKANEELNKAQSLLNAASDDVAKAKAQIEVDVFTAMVNSLK